LKPTFRSRGGSPCNEIGRPPATGCLGQSMLIMPRDAYCRPHRASDGVPAKLRRIKCPAQCQWDVAAATPRLVAWGILRKSRDEAGILQGGSGGGTR
jgi:hypothetical protein